MNKEKVCPVCRGSGSVNQLSSFEKEIIRLKKEGLTTRQIGLAVGLAHNTIVYHLKKIRG